MEKTTLFVDVHNLQRLDLLGKLTRSNVGIYVQQLAVGALGQAGEDRECASADGSLDWPLIDASDFAHETVLVAIKVVGGEDARGDGARTRTEFLQGSNEAEVFLLEDASSDLESFGV